MTFPTTKRNSFFRKWPLFSHAKQHSLIKMAPPNIKTQFMNTRLPGGFCGRNLIFCWHHPFKYKSVLTEVLRENRFSTILCQHKYYRNHKRTSWGDWSKNWVLIEYARLLRIIAVSLNARIVNVYIFYAIWVRLHPDLNTHAFGHCVFFFRQEGHRPSMSEGSPTPVIVTASLMTLN